MNTKNLVVYRLNTGGEISQLMFTCSADEAYECRIREIQKINAKQFKKRLVDKISSVNVYDENGREISFIEIRNGRKKTFLPYIKRVLKGRLHAVDEKKLKEYEALMKMNIALVKES